MAHHADLPVIDGRYHCSKASRLSSTALQVSFPWRIAKLFGPPPGAIEHGTAFRLAQGVRVIVHSNGLRQPGELRADIHVDGRGRSYLSIKPYGDTVRDLRQYGGWWHVGTAKELDADVLHLFFADRPPAQGQLPATPAPAAAAPGPPKAQGVWRYGSAVAASAAAPAGAARAAADVGADTPQHASLARSPAHDAASVPEPPPPAAAAAAAPSAVATAAASAAALACSKLLSMAGALHNCWSREARAAPDAPPVIPGGAPGASGAAAGGGAAARDSGNSATRPGAPTTALLAARGAAAAAAATAPGPAAQRKRPKTQHLQRELQSLLESQQGAAAAPGAAAGVRAQAASLSPPRPGGAGARKRQLEQEIVAAAKRHKSSGAAATGADAAGQQPQPELRQQQRQQQQQQQPQPAQAGGAGPAAGSAACRIGQAAQQQRTQAALGGTAAGTAGRQPRQGCRYLEAGGVTVWQQGRVIAGTVELSAVFCEEEFGLVPLAAGGGTATKEVTVYVYRDGVRQPVPLPCSIRVGIISGARRARLKGRNKPGTPRRSPLHRILSKGLVLAGVAKEGPSCVRLYVEGRGGEQGGEQGGGQQRPPPAPAAGAAGAGGGAAPRALAAPPEPPALPEAPALAAMRRAVLELAGRLEGLPDGLTPAVAAGFERAGISGSGDADADADADAAPGGPAAVQLQLLYGWLRLWTRRGNAAQATAVLQLMATVAGS